jgi:hypothetical protein
MKKSGEAVIKNLPSNVLSKVTFQELSYEK